MVEERLTNSSDVHRTPVEDRQRSRSTLSPPAHCKERITIQLSRAATPAVPEKFSQLSQELLVPADLTVAQFVRGAKKRLKLSSSESSLSIYIEGAKPSSSLSLKSLQQTHGSSDGTLHITYKTSSKKPSGPKEASPRATTGAKGPKSESSDSGLPASGSRTLTRLFGDGALGQGVEDGQKIDLANAVELVQIRSDKEVKAVQKFRNRMSKRAAGPRESNEAPTNLELAQALANLKLDTCLSGMIQAAINPSGTPSPPTQTPRPIPSICGGARIPAVCATRT
mmetsp:Transcript_47127/g.73734  ORF Transcript_47127/g.73734 Transcript_47127/m.73734 type:complete len:282 (-) Transcript_47127:219-1064(-)